MVRAASPGHFLFGANLERRLDAVEILAHNKKRAHELGPQIAGELQNCSREITGQGRKAKRYRSPRYRGSNRDSMCPDLSRGSKCLDSLIRD